MKSSTYWQIKKHEVEGRIDDAINLLIELLAKHDGNQIHAAKALGVNERTFRRTIQRYAEQGRDIRVEAAKRAGTDRKTA